MDVVIYALTSSDDNGSLQYALLVCFVSIAKTDTINCQREQSEFFILMKIRTLSLDPLFG